VIISGKILGAKKLAKQLKAVEKIGVAQLMKRISAATLEVEMNAKRNLRNTGSGTPTTRYRPKRTVLVSLPGKPPNTDRGTAVQSIFHFIDFVKQVGSVGTNLKYLAALEFPSRKNKRKARPWLKPALDKFIKTRGAKFFRFKFPKARVKNG